MKKAILILALFLGVGTVKVNAQAQHNNKKGCCLLIGKIWDKESCYCPGCVADAKKKADAKAKEDAQKLAAAKKKVEENKKKALEDKKKSDEKQAAEIKKRKENVLHVVAPNVENNETNKPEAKKDLTANENAISEEKKDFDEANATETEIVEWLNANKSEVDTSRSEFEDPSGYLERHNFSDCKFIIGSYFFKFDSRSRIRYGCGAQYRELQYFNISDKNIVITTKYSYNYKFYIENAEVREKFAKALRRLAILQGAKLK